MNQQNPWANYANPYGHQPTMVMRPAADRRALKWVLASIAVLFALLIGLLLLLLIGVETGPVGLLTGMVFATIPVPIYITLVLWIDRYEAEPLWLLALVFLWGATIAVFIAYIVNTLSAVIAAQAMQSSDAGEFFGAVISAPLSEESAKALVLFILFFWKKDEFDGVIDGIVYAAMVGLGFAMTENIMYYGRAALQSTAEQDVLTATFIIRGAMAPFSHPLFTSMTGIGLGLASQSKSTFVKLIAPLIGLGFAMFLHATWNFSASAWGIAGFFVTYFLVMVPMFVAALVSIYFALRREGRIVREHLLCDYQRGLFSPEEYNRLCTVRGRIGASFRALTGGGFGTWRMRMQFNQAASELAFHRSRLARGIMSKQNPAEREAAYIQLLLDLRRRLGPH